MSESNDPAHIPATHVELTITTDTETYVVTATPSAPIEWRNIQSLFDPHANHPNPARDALSPRIVGFELVVRAEGFTFQRIETPEPGPRLRVVENPAPIVGETGPESYTPKTPGDVERVLDDTPEQ